MREAQDLIFTGERYMPSEKGKIRLEHYHRYAVALELSKDKDILDVACGEGYGSSMLATVARSAVGVDISGEVISHASGSYENSNLVFQQGNVTKLDFEDDSFDVVVSFETVEHLAEQAEMIAELRRVLRAEGCLIISSPNRPVYSEESGEVNDFHVKELDFTEFDDLLKQQFSLVAYYGQRIQIGSLLRPLTGQHRRFRAWHDDGEEFRGTSGECVDPEYFLAVCGSSESKLPELGMSSVYPDKTDLVKHYVGFARWAKTLEKEVVDRDEQIAVLKQELTKRDEQVASLTEETVKRGEWALGLDAELERARADFLKINRSTSWRVTLPLREVRRWFISPARQARRYIKGGLRTSKRVYQSLPLSYRTRAIHRQWVSKYFPAILLASGSHSSTIPVFRALTDKSCHTVSKEVPRYTMGTALPDLAPYTSDEPVISVIIPVYGKLEYTLQCLGSIVENPPQVAFEVVVVDDQSPDKSADVIVDVDGVRLIRNKNNQGFIRSCNKGAKEAKGEYICFLNNDTEVTPGWLDELLRTFYEFPGTGLAGSKLIYPDGRLQEAGGIIWQDGSAWNFGRFQDPSLPIYNYAREVDYCSGASVMVPKVLFEDLGGFDEHFLPAYCEDSDLALKLRDKGYRVIYQPLSTVVHHEGITSGTDTSRGTKAYQVENSIKVFERWQKRLQAHQAPGVDVDNAKDRRAKHRVLYIDHCTPTPDQDSGSIDAYNHMLLLREMDFQVTFIPEDNFLRILPYTLDLQRAGIEALYSPYVTSVEEHLKSYGRRYDLVILCRPGVAEKDLGIVRKMCPTAKVVFHTVDLHFLRMLREADMTGDKSLTRAAKEMKRVELNLMERVDITTVISKHELQLLGQNLPADKVKLLPYSRKVRGTDSNYSERKDIVFIGGYQHAPNVDAVQYFCTEIMPLLRKKNPGIKVYIVGSNPPPEIRILESEDVIVTGFIQDLDPLLDKMRVSIAPLRYGAGIKGKIGTAMAVGLPVVATSLAVEGMSLANRENILVADGAEEFSNAIVEIYQDENLWERISENSLVFANQEWGAEAAWKGLENVLLSLDIAVKRANYPLSLYNSSIRPENGSRDRAQLVPIGVVENRVQFEHVLNSSAIKEIIDTQNTLLKSADGKEFFLTGRCVPCDNMMPLLVNLQSGGQSLANGDWQPNWRESLMCSGCQMNNRQRLIATLVKQLLVNKQGLNVYFMEQVTPIFQWAYGVFKQHHLYGSEYLGHEYKDGDSINGIRHEDVEALSFDDNSLDLIVSNDVFEHVPHPFRAFAECVRVLKPGGIMLATIPFHTAENTSVIRARLIDGKLEKLLPASYHGNPISASGSLVFTDFGWDMLDVMRKAGFSSTNVEVYASAEYGHLGGGQIVFRAIKKDRMSKKSEPGRVKANGTSD